MEFEAKVLFDAEKYIDIMEKVNGNAILTPDIREDEYWSKYDTVEEAKKNGESLTRIRVGQDGRASYLTLKKKQHIDGFENNVEKETAIGDVEILRLLLIEAGYKKYFTKKKVAYLLENFTDLKEYDGVMHVELVKVSNENKKFYGLEIEIVSDNVAPLPSLVMEKMLKNTFEKYGFTEKDFETKSWNELLRE